MLNNINQSLHQLAIEFLEQKPQQRLEILREYGIARYTFLTKINLNRANIACVMRYLANPKVLKFPNLVGADLSGLILDEETFIRGNLSGANLSKSSCIKADFLFANFTDANLGDANLTGATLNETIWKNTIVSGCQFGTGIGLTPSQRQYLQLRGGLFTNQAQV